MLQWLTLSLVLQFVTSQSASPGWPCNLVASLTPKSDSSFRAYRWCTPDDAARADAPVLEFGSLGAMFVVVGDSTQNNLNHPVDLAFKPMKPCELWVLNKGSDSVSIFFNPGTRQLVSDYYRGQGGNSWSEWRQDNNACHFMAEPNAIVFGGIPELPSNPDFAGQDVQYTDQGTFVTVQDSDNGFSVYGEWLEKRSDTVNARYGGNFMGPTLWPADLESFAIKNNDVYPYNVALVPEGSHLSMLHQQPFGAGVAYSGNNATFYMWDGGIDSIYGAVSVVTYREDHGYGGFRHRVAGIKRFHGTDLKKVPSTPGHMVLLGNWLYIADTGNGRVVRLDVDSGTDTGPVMETGLWREGYDYYNLIEGATMEEVTTGIPLPIGLAVSTDQQRLFVSDGQFKDIWAISLDPSDHGTVIEKLRTPAASIAGLEVDAATERLYYVDPVKSELIVVNPVCSEEAGCSDESPFDEVCDTIRDTNKGVDENGLYPSIYEPFADPDNHFGGCGREYYVMCPGGNPLKEPGGVLEVCKPVLGEVCYECCNRGTGECEPLDGGGGSSDCTFSDEIPGWTLLRYACGNHVRYPTLDLAEDACCTCGDECGGVTQDIDTGMYTIRQGSGGINGEVTWSKSSGRENSWTKNL